MPREGQGGSHGQWKRTPQIYFGEEDGRRRQKNEQDNGRKDGQVKYSLDSRKSMEYTRQQSGGHDISGKMYLKTTDSSFQNLISL